MSRTLSLLPLALLFLSLSMIAAIVIQLLGPSPLRRVIVDEAERCIMTLYVQSEALFLAEQMTPGDSQFLEHGERGVELIGVQRIGNVLEAQLQVRARRWRGWNQYGNATLVPGEKFNFITPRYKYSGIITRVSP